MTNIAAAELYGLIDPARLLSIIDRARRSPAASWLGMLMITALATGIRLMMPTAAGMAAPYISYTFAIMPITVFFGPAHGTIALALSVFLNWYLYVLPNGGPDSYVYWRTGMFVASSMVSIGTFAFLVEIIRYQIRKRQRLHILLREVSHRGNNLMAVVAAMARQTLDISSPSDFQESFAKRLEALGRSQALLIDGAYGSVSLANLLEKQLKPFNGAGQITWDGPSVDLNMSAVQYLGMALHEMATNAIKYGALSTPPGRILIRWQITYEEKLVLTWEEMFGPPVMTPIRSGYGTRTVKDMLVPALDSTSDLIYASDGLMWKLCASLKNVVTSGNHLSVYSMP